MNIFELSEEKIKEVLQNELNKVTPEELLEELIVVIIQLVNIYYKNIY